MRLTFFIARRYLFSKKKQNAINIISAISIVGVMIGTMALIVVLSVFNGMDQLLQKMYNADIQLLQGKERVGIINACLRLKMQTNNEVLFELDGEEGIGLMVQIKIPCKYLTQEAAVC